MQKSSSQRFSFSTWRRFVTIAKPLFFSADRFKALGLLVLLFTLSMSVTRLSVWMSEIAGSYMNALTERKSEEFYRSIRWFAVAVLCTTPVVVMYRYTEEKFALLWRRFLAQYYITRYFSHRSYYRINLERSLDNPDQRIADEIRNFAGTSISFFLILLNSVINLSAWSYVLWRVSPTLSATSFVYAFLGSLGTMLIGRRLVSLNFAQQKKEADFRYRLVQIRDNSESVALYRGEDKEATQILYRLRDALHNLNMLIGWNRNLGFFTRSYEYFKAVVPVLIVAPLYFTEQTNFGALTQATIAFAWVLDALSLIVSQFERLSAFAATIARVGALSEELDKGDRYCVWPRENPTWITIGTDSKLVLDHLTVMTPNRQRTLISGLNLTVDAGQHLLITGASGVGKTSLFRAIAGLWTDGQGIIKRPDLDSLVFLPQTPYMLLGTFRQQLLYSTRGASISDAQLTEVLERVRLGELLARIGGFDAEMDWLNVLSLGEQQRIAFARLLLAKPRIAFLDEATTALDLEDEKYLYGLLQESGQSYVSIGHRASLVSYHDLHLELLADGKWKLV
ncbi:MAG: ABC transporter ATP-binding protein/permease [Deltaproteobacteria bacterium]|nr:ABC transporter ATP-binding protein/permease [Deltaproteobacteria bacterium]